MKKLHTFTIFLLLGLVSGCNTTSPQIETPALPVEISEPAISPTIYISDNDDSEAAYTENRNYLFKKFVFPKSISISPNGKFLALATTSGVNIYNLELLEIDVFLLLAEPMIKWSPDSKLLAGVSEDGEVKIFDMERKKVITVFPGNENFGKKRVYESIAWSPDGKILALSRDMEEIIWGWMSETNEWKKYSERFGTILEITWRDDNHLIAAGKFFNIEGIWDITKNDRVSEINYSQNVALSGTWSPKNNFIIITYEGDISKVWDVVSGEQYILERSDFTSNFAWHPTGNKLALYSYLQTIIVMDTNSWDVIAEYPFDKHQVDLAWTPDGGLISLVKINEEWFIWDIINNDAIMNVGNLQD